MLSFENQTQMENPQNNLTLALLAYLAQRGLPIDKICQLAGIDQSWITAKNRLPLSNKQLDDLWANSIHWSGDPELGLHFGESLQLSALGIVGELIKTSATVGQAVETAATLGHLVAPWFKMRSSKSPTAFTLYIEPVAAHWPHSLAARQTLAVLLVLTIHELDGLLLKRVSPIKATYSLHTESPNEWQRVLRCPALHLGTENSITFDIAYWNEAIITANYELQCFLRDKISEATEKIVEEKFADKISRYLFDNAYLGTFSLEEIAANFNMSTRTLQRKLKNEKLSFQQLADNVRQQLAQKAIAEGNYAVKEIAYSLGYNELSAFSRAFKRWTGISPETYRARL